jgi:hypothetical protein
MFLCPCCGESYLVPLAFCESILEARVRGGWKGTIAPSRCLACQLPVVVGDSIVIRKGSGVSGDGERQDLPIGSKATVVEVSTWEGEGSIFRVRLPAGKEVYLTRAQFALDRAGLTEQGR